MNTPFSELYSKYYTLTSHLLSLMSDAPMDMEDIRKLVTLEGFIESPFCFLPTITSQDEEGYHLLKRETSIKGRDTYHSILRNSPQPFLTQLQTEWLKSLLEDNKLHLFLEEEDCWLLKKALCNVQPLLSCDQLSYARQQDSRASYYSPSYIRCFKLLLQSLKEEKLIRLCTDQNKILFNGNFSPDSSLMAPYKIEYAILEDQFSLLAITIIDNVPDKLLRIPLNAITDISLHDTSPARSLLDDFVKSCKCKEPLYFEINNMRSGFERTFMYLSPYERITQYNEENDTCLVQLYYYPFDEDQLIDMLISFGPVIKILGPSSIRSVFKSKIEKQYELFANFFTH